MGQDETWMLMNEHNSVKEALQMDDDEYLQTYRVIKDDTVQILEANLNHYRRVK